MSFTYHSKKKKRLMIQQNFDIEEECPICLEQLHKGEYQKVLDCKHCFHKKCIDRWFKKDNDFCPMCRLKVIK